MKKYIIVADKPKNLEPQNDCLILSSSDFIQNKIPAEYLKSRNVKVINLCTSFDYLSKGYYVSLLAKARHMPCIPDIANIIKLNWKRNYESALPDLNTTLKSTFLEPADEPLTRIYTTYFGRHENKKLEPVTRKLFDLFRFPALSFEVKYKPNKNAWVVDKVEALSFANIPDEWMEKFNFALDKFTGSAWKMDKAKKAEKYWIAILYDPEFKMCPSDKAALNKFIRVGKQMGLWVELITKNDYSSLLEFDALFIRVPTSTNNYTYKFALKAEEESIPCIDDTQSIIKCCNKVYLHELLKNHNIPTPRTIVIDKRILQNIELEFDFPVVLKIPDGSFSLGVTKAENLDDFKLKASEMLKKSEIILCQEFIKSDFDWRIGVLNKQVIFVSKYFMARNHWQIQNNSAKKKADFWGDDSSHSIEETPKQVIKVAIEAANLIGNGLYGVDLKQTENGDVVVIEINDNPSIDANVEDKVEGDELYRKILARFVEMIEQ